MQKGKPGEISLPFIEKRYHKYFRPLIFAFSLRDCRKSSKMAIIEIFHVMK